MEVNSNMGGEMPGVSQADQFRDSLHVDERPASNSSADSRGMDDSPVDEPADSQESLNVEKQYQDDLKERVRQSFMDLGMEPEGVLTKNRDEADKSARRKERPPTSERQASHKSGRSGSKDGARKGSLDEVPSDQDNEPVDYTDEPATYGDENAKDPHGPSEASNDPGASSDTDPEAAHENQAIPTRYPEDGGLGNDNPNEAYPNEDDDHISQEHPYGQVVDGELMEDQTHDDTTGQAGSSPTGQPEEGVINSGAPVNYPHEDTYKDAEYGINPADGEGIRNNTKPRVDPTAESDPDEDNYPQEDNYPKGTYPEWNSYPNEDGYHADAGYPEESGYPEEGNYPQGGSYPEGEANDDVQHKNAYTPEGDSHHTKGQTSAIASSYPRRYDNQGYDDDEEQYHMYDDQIQTSNEHQNPFDELPDDSLDYGKPTRNDAVPPDFEEPDNAAKDGTAQDLPNTKVSENFLQDSLEIEAPEQAQKPTNLDDTHEGDDIDDKGAEDAPYDSLEEDEPYIVPSTIPSHREDELAGGHGENENSPQEERPGNQQPSVPRDAPPRSGHCSNNSSANPSRELNGSLGSGKLSNSDGSPIAGGSAGLRDLPPQGRRQTPSRSGSRGLGSRASNHRTYSDLARQRASANQNGSAGSNSSSEGTPPQQSPQGNTKPGNETRARSLSNRTKATPIPADELSAKELLKRAQSKSDAAVDIAEVEHSNSQVISKNGEEVRVAYISDDSGDEGEHFLDEKGSPIDQFGKPLYKDLHGKQIQPEEPKLEFRIKPTPPKEKSPRDLQTINAKRTSEDDGRSPSGKNSHSGRITIAKPFPLEEAIVKNEMANQTGNLDETLPPWNSTPKYVPEPIIQKTAAHQEGVNESTHPPAIKDKTESLSGSASKSRIPFGEVRLRSVGTVMSGKTIGQGRTPPVVDTKDEDPYRDLRFETDSAHKHGRDNQSAVQRAINKDLEVEKKHSTNHTPQTRRPPGSTYRETDFENPEDYPSVSRGASGASYQDRGIQYTPQTGQNRERQASSKSQGTPDPMFQQPYSAPQGYPVQHPDEFSNQEQHLYPTDQGHNALINRQPGYPAAPQQSHGNSDRFQMQQGWDQQPPGVPWNNAHLSQMPQQFYYGVQPAPQSNRQQGRHNPPEEYFDNQHYPGYNPSVERPDVPYQDQAQFYDQQHSYSAGYQHNPGAVAQQARPPGPQDIINHSQNPGRLYPNQAMQPAPGQYPNQGPPAPTEQPRQRGPPKTKPNFIDLNKTNFARGPPRRRYTEMQKKALTPTRINPKKPLPDISGESSQYDDPLAEDADNLGSAQMWAHEDWTRQLIQDQRNRPLRRGHSDTNLYIQNQAPGPIPQGYYPQGAPAMSGYKESSPGYTQPPQAYQPGYNQTYLPQVPRSLNGQPYSYSADHATHIARNNGFGYPQMSGPPRARVAFADDYRDSFESDVNPMTYAIEGTGVGHQHATKRTSPYNVLPDIPGHSRTGEDRTSPLRKSDPDSYTARLLKQKQPPQYKEYTLKDYRNLKSDVRLGGLGPDQDLITEKQDKVNRQRDYAKIIMEQNKKQLQQTRRVWPKESVHPNDAPPSKRDLAKEYSKKVPKPRMPTPPEVLHERLYGASSRQHGASSRQQAQEESEHEERAASEMARLEELRTRHEKEKEEVEKLKMEVLP